MKYKKQQIVAINVNYVVMTLLNDTVAEIKLVGPQFDSGDIFDRNQWVSIPLVPPCFKH